MVNMWEHIEKDIERTRKEMNFFSLSTQVKMNESLVWLSRSKAKMREKKETDNLENHRDVLSRVLFVFARTNVAVGYAQGMNEIAAVLYYCFYTMSDPEDMHHAEADTFWCFFNLIVAVVSSL
jgi:TBC1 domain family member 13